MAYGGAGARCRDTEASRALLLAPVGCRVMVPFLSFPLTFSLSRSMVQNFKGAEGQFQVSVSSSC